MLHADICSLSSNKYVVLDRQLANVVVQGKHWAPWTDSSWKSQSCSDFRRLHDVLRNIRLVISDLGKQ